MPNANIAAGSNRAVKRAPRWQVARVAILGISQEVLNRSPVLDHDRGSAEPHFTAEHAGFWPSRKLREHARHRLRNGPPPVHFPNLVDAHAYEEHNKVTLDACGNTLSANYGSRP